ASKVFAAPFTRRDIGGLSASDPIITGYKTAVTAMKALSASDPTDPWLELSSRDSRNARVGLPYRVEHLRASHKVFLVMAPNVSLQFRAYGAEVFGCLRLPLAVLELLFTTAAAIARAFSGCNQPALPPASRSTKRMEHRRSFPARGTRRYQRGDGPG